MTDDSLEQYILNYEPKKNKDIELARIDGYNFTFLIYNGKTIGVVLDMISEPHIYILPEYRGKGFGVSLLKQYLIENNLVRSNKYVFYNAGTCDGEKLIDRFIEQYTEFNVIKVGIRKYIILSDTRFRMLK